MFVCMHGTCYSEDDLLFSQSWLSGGWKTTGAIFAPQDHCVVVAAAAIPAPRVAAVEDLVFAAVLTVTVSINHICCIR